MNEERPGLSTLTQLRDVKDSLGLVDPPPARPADDSRWGDEVLASPACVNCGYTQQGQIIDRCPECGLGWASRLHDSTPWGVLGPSVLSWASTVFSVVTWDERLRVRSALIPATPASRRFSTWCVLLAVVFTSLVLASEVSSPGITAAAKFIAFLITLTVRAMVLGVVLLGTLSILRYALKGVWRRRLTFIPSSLDYSTAWWCFVSILLLFIRFLSKLSEDKAPFPLIGLSALLGGILWVIWLWASVSESGHIERVGARVFCATAGCALMGIWGIGFSFDALSNSVNGALVRSATTVAGAKTFFSGGKVLPTAPPRTYALVIDVIPSGDEGIVRDGLMQLGVTVDTLVTLQNEKATLEEIEKTFAEATVKLRPQDQFIVYINGHGAQEGSGLIRVADGYLTSQKLRHYLSLVSVSTNESLVIIDSCFGGKFIDAMRPTVNAVVLATTDDLDLAYRNSLDSFWFALNDSSADINKDGDITIKEAFTSAYRKMLKRGEDLRRDSRNRTFDPRLIELLDKSGFATPQLESLGTAKADAFSAEIKKPTKPAQ